LTNVEESIGPGNLAVLDAPVLGNTSTAREYVQVFCVYDTYDTVAGAWYDTINGQLASSHGDTPPYVGPPANLTMAESYKRINGIQVNNASLVIPNSNWALMWASWS
jgi:hypothetical protein